MKDRNNIFTTTAIFNCMKSTHANKFRNMTDEEVWMEFQTNPNKDMVNWAQEELLTRYNAMLSKIANSISGYYRHIGDYEDFFQIARMGAITAFRRYNPYKFADGDEKKATLFTFVTSTVPKYLLTQADELGYIRCPAQKRAMRAYFSGKYDDKPQRKKEFEKEQGWATEEDIRDAQEKYKLLTTEVVSYEAQTTSDDGVTVEREFTNAFSDNQDEDADGILNRLDWESAISRMTAIQQDIYQEFFVEGNTVKECANILNYSERDINAEIKNIRMHLKRYFPEMAEGRQLSTAGKK